MLRGLLLSGLLPSVLALQSCNVMQGCPSEESVKKTLSQKIPPSAKVVSIKPVEKVGGICEVVLKDGMSVAVIYTNKDVSRVFVGHLYETQTHKSLTLQSIESNMKLTKEEVSKLDSLVSIDIGEGKKHIYYITAPNCNACKLFEDVIIPWSKEKGVKVRIILVSNPLHQESYEIAVSTLCDKKTLEDMRKGYKSENLCDEGKKTIDKAIKVVFEDMKLQVVPHVIGTNGKIISRLPTKSMLDELLK